MLGNILVRLRFSLNHINTELVCQAVSLWISVLIICMTLYKFNICRGMHKTIFLTHYFIEHKASRYALISTNVQRS
jgi:hypothetical protein